LRPSKNLAEWYLRLTVNDKRRSIARVGDTLARKARTLTPSNGSLIHPKNAPASLLYFAVEPVSEPNVGTTIGKIKDFHLLGGDQ
jgi:hypothetical protein